MANISNYDNMDLLASLDIQRKAPGPVTKFIDYFIHPRLKKSSDDLYRGRILVGICLVIFISVLVFILGVTFLANLDIQTRVGGYVITIPMALFFVAIPFFFKKTGAHNLCSNLISGIAFVAVSIGVFISGGPIVSPASYVMAIPTLLCFCLTGRRWGMFWAVMVFTVQMIMLVMGLNGYQFINTVSPEYAALNEATDWALAYIMTIGIIIVYESMQFRLKQERDAQEQKFLFLATHDMLTNLPNRVLFYDRAKTAMSRSKRQSNAFALLYLDLNGFKPINDEFGHEAGDYVLKTVSERMRASLRESDIIARFGGDEFAVIAEELKDTDNALAVAQKIHDVIEEPIEFRGKSLSVSTSVGIAFYPHDGTTIDELLSHSDAAMYEAKQSGKDIVRYDMLKQKSG